jgi:hypothetical protein
MANEFAGIHEKLKRANEDIGNLNTEIIRFIDTGEYPVLPHADYERMLEAIAYHKKRIVPPRFSVLAGEIVHHLRSCLDHIVWHFSSPSSRVEQGHRKFEFPVFYDDPISKEKMPLYEGKIKGITNSRVRKLINDFQPYKTSDPSDSNLLILHNMDIWDKHRELLLCISAGHLALPPEMVPPHLRDKPRHLKDLFAEIAPEIKEYGKVTPQVAFREFGKRKPYPVVLGLTEIYDHVVDIVGAFEREIM